MARIRRKSQNAVIAVAAERMAAEDRATTKAMVTTTYPMTRTHMTITRERIQTMVTTMVTMTATKIAIAMAAILVARLRGRIVAAPAGVGLTDSGVRVVATTLSKPRSFTTSSWLRRAPEQ